MTSRTAQRLALGAAAILSVADAVALLPWRDGECRAWLEARGLIRRRADVPGPYVHWGEVEAELRLDEPEPVKPTPVATLERAGLGRRHR